LLPYLNPLFREKGVVLNRGKLNSDILCTITGTGKSISIKGNSSVLNCNAFAKNFHWKDVDIDSVIDITIENFSRFTFAKKFVSKAQLNNEKAGTVIFEGFFDLNGENNLSINITDLASDFFMPLLIPKMKNLTATILISPFPLEK